MKLIRKHLANSILRQSQTQTEPFQHKSTARFETVLINGRETKINARLLPPDLPTHSEWFAKRIWSDEIEGRALTC